MTQYLLVSGPGSHARRHGSRLCKPYLKGIEQ